MLGTVPARLPIHVKTRGGEGEHALPAPTGQAHFGLVEVRERIVQLLLQGERGWLYLGSRLSRHPSGWSQSNTWLGCGTSNQTN